MSTSRKFTWEELVSLNQKHNAHIAVRGKVRKTSIAKIELQILSILFLRSCQINPKEFERRRRDGLLSLNTFPPKIKVVLYFQGLPFHFTVENSLRLRANSQNFYIAKLKFAEASFIFKFMHDCLRSNIQWMHNEAYISYAWEI